MNPTETARQLFAAFAAGDMDAVRTLCSPDLKAIQNYAPPMDLEALLGFSASVNAMVSDFRYEDAIRTATDTGFVEEHLVCGSLPDGSELRFAACVVAEIRDGRICELREYIDTGAARKLVAALAQV